MNIAIIPARGGSKRIPKKNIIDFNGLPMIGYPIHSALTALSIDQVFVTTDSEEIADIAKDLGAKVPFLRPSSLSDDHTPTKPVIEHSIRALNDLGIRPKHVCCIYPCTPLITSRVIDEIYNTHDLSNSLFTYPVLRYSHPIQRAMTMDYKQRLSMLFPENELVRTQDLKPAFHDSGQFYWGQSTAWISSKTMLHSDGIGVEIDKTHAVDIDNIDDLELAKLIYKFNTATSL